LCSLGQAQILIQQEKAGYRRLGPDAPKPALAQAAGATTAGAGRPFPLPRSQTRPARGRKAGGTGRRQVGRPGNSRLPPTTSGRERVKMRPGVGPSSFPPLTTRAHSRRRPRAPSSSRPGAAVLPSLLPLGGSLTIVIVADFLLAASLTVRHGPAGHRRLPAPAPPPLLLPPRLGGETQGLRGGEG
jgi:hypothetical protein